MIIGSLVALVTPMDEVGAIDLAALARLIEFHVAAGSQGIVIAGTTGEAATLTSEEHCDLIRRSVELAQGRLTVIAGTGSNSTAEAIELTCCAAAAGADACLLITPYYNKPTQEGLYRHHRAIAEAVDIAQILYNVPGRTACDLGIETAVRLAAVPGIVGLKDATADLARVAQLKARCGPGFALYSGDDASAMDFMLAGGHGVISVTANCAPAAMRALCDAALAADAAGAAQANAALADLHRDLFLESNPIPVKWALTAMGLIGAGIRLPLTPLSASHHERLHAALRRARAL